MSTLLDSRAAALLAKIEAQGLGRRLVNVEPGNGAFLRTNGRRYCNLSSNDYLGLSNDQALVQEFYRDLGLGAVSAHFLLGSASSRLMAGNSPLHGQLERRLAQLYAAETALVFNSGYHANIGILPALFGKGDLVVADKLCHASLIDGIRLCRAESRRYPHNDLDRLEELLVRERQRHDQVVIVTESVFSMDGDLADLDRLVAIKRRFDCVLYVDEAHAVGVFGLQGLGLAEERGLLGDVDLLVGTFGKAIASQGAFVVCSRVVAELLVNTMRPLIFTTALPPVALAWTDFILARIPAMNTRRTRLRQLGETLRTELGRRGVATLGASQIVPVLVGEAERTVRLAEQIREQGFWVLPVRPPTVPEGSSRFRLSLRTDLGDLDLSRLVEILAKVLGQG